MFTQSVIAPPSCYVLCCAALRGAVLCVCGYGSGGGLEGRGDREGGGDLQPEAAAVSATKKQ